MIKLARRNGKSLAERDVPEFGPGDTLRVDVKVVEGTRERIQAFEGVCIARKSAGVNSSFTVRKISYGEGVERIFALFTAGCRNYRYASWWVRRAKLYYLRGRTGKAARIAEKARDQRQDGNQNRSQRLIGISPVIADQPLLTW